MALVRPIMEYPSVQINNANTTNIIKLQRLQNTATRFIANYARTDKKSSKYLHEITKMEPMNIRLNKLKNKLIYKLHEAHCPKDRQYPLYINMGSDYMHTNEPNKIKRRTLANNIIKYIYINKKDCPWYSPLDHHSIADPPPIYK